VVLLREKAVTSRKDKHRVLRFVACCALAFCVHGLTLAYLVLSGAFSQTMDRALPLVLSGLSAREADPVPLDIESLVDDSPNPDQKDAPETPKKEPEDKKLDGQVVEVAPPSIEVRPRDARFLSEYDTATQHETKGQVGKDHVKAAMPSQNPTAQHPARQDLPPGDPRAKMPTTDRVALLGPSGEKMPGPKKDQSEVSSVEEDGTLPHSTGQGAVTSRERVGLPTLPGMGPLKLSPSKEFFSGTLGTGSPDALMDLDEGDATLLNSKKWKFAGFFNRLKLQIREDWHPDQVLARHDPSGNIYGHKPHATVLKVELTLDGRVHDVTVLKPSGMVFLDEEAMSAVRRAQPFENPPEPLADPDKIIRFRFGFVVEQSGFSSFRVHKY
jgi:TonB family protein